MDPSSNAADENCVLYVLQTRLRPSSFSPFLVMPDITARLATVELQLLLHCLNAPELLRFARCNRRLLTAAEQPFSWKIASFPVDVVTRPSVPPETNLPASRSSWPLCVRWTMDTVFASDEADSGVRSTLAFFGTVHLRELILRNPVNLTAQQITDTLASSHVTANLRSLIFADTQHSLHVHLSSAIVRNLSHLTTLKMCVATNADWTCFVAMSALSTLALSVFSNPSVSDTRQLSLCRSLRDLTVRLHDAAESIRCLSGLPSGSLRHIDRFTLVGWRGVDVFDATGLLKTMPALHTLALHQCASMDSILRNLARVRSRTLLRLAFHVNPAVGEGSKWTPTTPVIVLLMCAMGQLRCDLEPTAPPSLAPRHVHSYLDALRAKLRADASLQSFGDRLRIM